MSPVLLTLGLLLCAAPLSAQRIDSDWCLTCRDSRQHFVAGAGVHAATLLVFPRAPAWKRLAITFGVAAAFEAGQADARGMFGPKDLLVGMLGAALVEVGWRLAHKRRP